LEIDDRANIGLLVSAWTLKLIPDSDCLSSIEVVLVNDEVAFTGLVVVDADDLTFIEVLALDEDERGLASGSPVPLSFEPFSATR